MFVSEGRAPLVVARGAERFFPRVVVADRVYLGARFPGRGYQFIELDLAHGDAHVVDHEGASRP